jgi:P4 family phage/plasmid primase-like protien
LISKEKQVVELDSDTIETFASLFHGRTDAWGSISAPRGRCNREPVTLEHYERHLRGEVSLGIYPLLDDGTCNFFAIDLDKKDFNLARMIRDELTKNNIPAYIAESKSKGYHIYGFAFEDFVAKEIRRVVYHILDKLNINIGPGSAEIFPKQDCLIPTPNDPHPVGNYINLPCFGNTRPFLSGDMREVPLKIALERIKFVPQESIDRILRTLPEGKIKEGRLIRKWPGRSDEFNTLAIEKLLESCAFIQHCRDDATTLSEPHWWSMVHILAVFGEPGREKIHQLSQPYPRYTERETEQKIGEALKAADREMGPHTCEFIVQELGFTCPQDCLAKELGAKSPAGLAYKLATPKTFSLTDLGNAERLVSRHGKNIRYSEERKRWLVWNGRAWGWDFGAKVMSLAKETVRNILHEAADEKDDDRRKKLIKHAVRSESEARLAAMVNLAQSEAGIPVQSKELNSDPWLFNCLNGTIDLRTGELLPHNREDLITIISPVNYDPYASCELWLKFLDRVTGGSAKLGQYLQRAVGYSLTGDMRTQVMFFLYGLGNNGKSTFIVTIRKIMDGYGATAPVDMFLAKDKNARGPREDLANLQGKRFVAASEVEVGRRLAVVVIKEMTGGEAIRADRKYEHEIEFQPTHKLWISGNHKPVIADTSLAIWRRVKLIPFMVTIPDDEIDEDLTLKLETELSGILAWAVQGCLVWQRVGLKEPLEVIAATSAYRQEEDILAEYIQDCCVLKVTATVAKADLYENYKHWCENTGCQPVSQKTLRTRLMERGISEGKSGSVRYWRGIGLLESQEGEEGQLGREMTFFPENHVREKKQGKVLEKSVPTVPNVPNDIKNRSDAGDQKDPWDEFLEEWDSWDGR